MLERIGGEEGREEGCEKNGGSCGRERNALWRVCEIERVERREREEEEEEEAETQTETESGGEFESGKTG